MNRYALIRNIDLLRRHLDSGKTISEPSYYLGLIKNDLSALALLDAAERGACEHELYSPSFSAENYAEYAMQFPAHCEPSLFPCLIVDPRPGLVIANVNAACAAELMRSPAELIGRHLYDTCIEDSATLEADGVTNIFALMVEVMATGKPQALAEQRFNILPVGGPPVERHWWIEATPLFDADGRIAFIKEEFCQIASKTHVQAA